MYTITLSNGTKLENLKLNGNNYISDTIIDDSVFEGGLDVVVISDGETTETLVNMRLMSNRTDNGKSWFILGEKTQQQIQEEEIAELKSEIATLSSICSDLLYKQALAEME